MKKYAKQAGVKTLQGGVLYRVITEGNGPLAKATDTVKVTYEDVWPTARCLIQPTSTEAHRLKWFRRA